MALKLKLDPKLMAQSEHALEPFAQAFEDSDGFTLLVIGELRTAERTSKVIDGGEVVKARLITVHPVTGEAAHLVRQAARAAWHSRNIRGEVHEGGNLFADGQAIDLDPSAVQHLAGLWGFEEYARLRVGVEHWLEALRKVAALNPTQTSPERYQSDLKVIVDGLDATLTGAPQPDAPDAPEFHAITAAVEDLGGPTAGQIDDLIAEAEIVCGATLTVAATGGNLGFVVVCQRDEHEYGEDHAGIGEDGQQYTWPNDPPADVADEAQAGGER